MHGLWRKSGFFSAIVIIAVHIRRSFLCLKILPSLSCWSIVNFLFASTWCFPFCLYLFLGSSCSLKHILQDVVKHLIGSMWSCSSREEVIYLTFAVDFSSFSCSSSPITASSSLSTLLRFRPIFACLTVLTKSDFSFSITTLQLSIFSETKRTDFFERSVRVAGLFSRSSDMPPFVAVFRERVQRPRLLLTAMFLNHFRRDHVSFYFLQGRGWPKTVKYLISMEFLK